MGLLHGEGATLNGVEIAEVALERSRTSKTYRCRLKDGMDRFLLHLARVGVKGEWWNNPVLTNQLLVNVINEMKDNKVAICHARHVILAVQTCHRQLKGSLGRAWDCLRSWQLDLPTWSRVPIPILLLRSMFATAVGLALAETAHACHWFVFAILIRVGFAGLLRPGELMKLTAADVRLPQSEWEPGVVILRLMEPKNKSCLGRYQFTSIHDESLVRWLRWLTAGMEPSAKLWPGSQALFTKFWKRCVHLLNYTALGITPASLRPGGATYHFMQHQSIAALRIAGRWRAESSLEHYIQLVMSHLCLTQLGDEAHSFASSLAHASEQQWQQPPNKPWSCLFSRARQCQALEVVRRRRNTQRSSGTWQVASMAFPASTSL